jgi:hypothetical protein
MIVADAYGNAEARSQNEKQCSETGSQNKEEKNICESRILPYYSGF